MKNADLIIGEELKALRQILKAAGVQAKVMDQLNEHSTQDDVQYFVGECREKNVVLVSDCGTPGFCDPGAELVDACHRARIPVYGLPGPSSLMALLSVAGHRLESFFFAGFLPTKKEERERRWRELRKENRPIILLETPYRAGILAQELATHFAERNCVLGLNLTQENERVIRGKGRDLTAVTDLDDAEPVVLII